VIEFQRASKPLTGVLEHLTKDEELEVDLEVRTYLRDVRDHALRVTERVAGFRELLSDILSVNHTLVEISQNEQAKKISAWAAILFAPTLVAGIYGMNFDYMPELYWYFGYPYSLVLIMLVCTTLYLTFKRRDWL
jgi:magnesium transporter